MSIWMNGRRGLQSPVLTKLKLILLRSICPRAAKRWENIQRRLDQKHFNASALPLWQA
jgi:hypothetical protein